MGHFLCRKVGKLPEGTDASLCGGVYDCFFSVDFSMFEISGVFCNEEWWIMDIGVSEYGIYPPKKNNSWSFQCWPTLHDFVSPTKMQNQITGPFMPCTYQNPGLTKQLVGFLEKATSTRTSWWNQHLNTKGSGSLCSLKAILRQFHIRSLKSGSCGVFETTKMERLHPTWCETPCSLGDFAMLGVWSSHH